MYVEPDKYASYSRSEKGGVTPTGGVVAKTWTYAVSSERSEEGKMHLPVDMDIIGENGGTFYALSMSVWRSLIRWLLHSPTVNVPEMYDPFTFYVLHDLFLNP